MRLILLAILLTGSTSFAQILAEGDSSKMKATDDISEAVIADLNNCRGTVAQSLTAEQFASLRELVRGPDKQSFISDDGKTTLLQSNQVVEQDKLKTTNSLAVTTDATDILIKVSTINVELKKGWGGKVKEKFRDSKITKLQLSKATPTPGFCVIKLQETESRNRD